MVAHPLKFVDQAWCVISVFEKLQPMGIDMPICTEVYRVLYENKEPALAVRELMSREPTSERLV